MPASPTNTAVQVLILNTAFAVSGEAGPLLDTLETFDPASPWRRVSGDTAPLQIVLVDDGGAVVGTPRRVILANGNTLHLSAKVDPSDNDQALALDFTQAGAEGAEYYEANPGTLAVSDSVFNGNPSALLSVDLIEKNSGGDVLRQWRTTLCLLWSTASGGVSSPTTFVSYSVQSPTAPQQAQALTNLGGTPVGRAVFQAVDEAAARAAIGAAAEADAFDPASPGPIGGTTPDVVTSTLLKTPGIDRRFQITDETIRGFNSNGGALSLEIDSEKGSIRLVNLSGVGFVQSWDDVAFMMPNGELIINTLTLGGFTLTLGGSISFGTMGRTLAATETAEDARGAIELGDGSDVTFNSLTLTSFFNGTDATLSGSLDVDVAISTPSIGANSGVIVTLTSGNIEAPTSSGGTLKNAFGDTCFSWGLSGGTNASAILFSCTVLTVSANFLTVNGKALTAPDASGTLATLAGTEMLSNKSLVSPALGTPVSGNLANCDAASPTAKGVIELATRAEVLATVSTSLGITVQELMFLVMTPALKEMPKGAAAWTLLTSGLAAGGGATQHAYGSQLRGSSATTGGYAITDTVNNAHLHAGRSRGRHRFAVDFGKLVWCSFRMLTDSDFWNANAVFRFVFGKPASGTGSGIGDPGSTAFGVKQTGTGALQIIHYNGSLSTTATSFTPTYAQEYDVDLISYGNGTVECFVNGSSVGSSTGFSTALLSNTTTGICTQFEVDQISSFTSPQAIAYPSPGRIFVQP